MTETQGQCVGRSGETDSTTDTANAPKSKSCKSSIAIFFLGRPATRAGRGLSVVDSSGERPVPRLNSCFAPVNSAMLVCVGTRGASEADPGRVVDGRRCELQARPSDCILEVDLWIRRLLRDDDR